MAESASNFEVQSRYGPVEVLKVEGRWSHDPRPEYWLSLRFPSLGVKLTSVTWSRDLEMAVAEMECFARKLADVVRDVEEAATEAEWATADAEAAAFREAERAQAEADLRHQAEVKAQEDEYPF